MLGGAVKFCALQGFERQDCWAWMQGAQEALTTNASTVALKPIYELIGAGGILEHFRAQGYVVEDLRSRNTARSPSTRTPTRR